MSAGTVMIVSSTGAVPAAVGAAATADNGKLSQMEQLQRYTVLPVSCEPGGAEEITPCTKLKRARSGGRWLTPVADSARAA